MSRTSRHPIRTRAFLMVAAFTVSFFVAGCGSGRPAQSGSGGSGASTGSGGASAAPPSDSPEGVNSLF